MHAFYKHMVTILDSFQIQGKQLIKEKTVRCFSSVSAHLTDSQELVAILRQKIYKQECAVEEIATAQLAALRQASAQVNPMKDVAGLLDHYAVIKDAQISAFARLSSQ